MLTLTLPLLVSVGIVAEPAATAPALNSPAAVRAVALHTRATSTVALTVASADDGAASEVTLVATVNGQPGGITGGSVVFTSGGKRIGEAAVSHGEASLTLPALPKGFSTLSAMYVGDGSYLPSKSETVRFYQGDDRN